MTWAKANDCRGSTTFQVWKWNGREFEITNYAFDFRMTLSDASMKLEVR